MTVKCVSVLILMVCVIINTVECRGCDSDSVALVDGVPDSALTASSFYGSKEKYGPRYGKLRNTNGAGAWCPNTKGSEYLQVKFDKLQTICSVQTQGRKEYKLWVTRFYVRTSKDCQTFNDVQENGRRKIFAGNSDATSVRSNKLPSPVLARCVRIYPVSSHKFPCMRFGLRGIEVPSCPEGFADWRHSCYKLFNSRRFTWLDGVTVCREMGARLVTIDDAAENKWVLTWVKSQRIVYPYMAINLNEFAKFGRWTTRVDMKKETYYNWASGQPQQSGDEYCGFMFINANGALGDGHCDNKYPFACEIDYSK